MELTRTFSAMKRPDPSITWVACEAIAAVVTVMVSVFDPLLLKTPCIVVVSVASPEFVSEA